MAMANANLLPTQHTAVADTIAPDNHGTGTVTTGWVDMATFIAVAAMVQAGALGTSATLDAKVEQAQDSSGTGAADISGKAITQLKQADGDSNSQAFINVYADELDVNGGYTHARLSLTVGTASSDAAAVLFGFYPHYGPADRHNAASVVEIVS